MLPLEKATYLAHCTAITWGRAESTDNKQLAAHMVIDTDGFVGESIPWFGHFTDKTSDRTIESLQHMGWQGDDLFELYELDAEGCARLLPNQVEIDCEVESDQDGHPRLKVRWVNKLGGGRVAFKKPLEPQEMKAFAAQMRGAVRGAGARNATAKSSQSPSTSRPADQRAPQRASQPHPNAPGNSYGGFGSGPDDDIPFLTCDVAAEPSPIARVIR